MSNRGPDNSGHFSHLAAVLAAVILVILGGAVLHGALEKSRVRAMEAGCRANIKQVAMAMVMYSADYDDHLPPAERWPDLLNPYLRNSEVFVCPAQPKISQGYVLNDRLAGIRRSVVVGPAQTPMLFESDLGLMQPTGPLASVTYRHPGGAFLGYVDGHVEIRKLVN